MKRTLTFLFLWLCWGFTLGTILLLGPMRWTVDYGRKQSWAEGLERTTVIGYIAVLIIVSLLLAFFSMKLLFKQSTSGVIKGIAVALPVIGIAVSVYVFLHPEWVNSEVSSKEETVSAHFGVGPYPELKKMYELQAEGYTAIISLLHPAVVPFEPSLLEKERNNAKEVGLEFIHIPLLPWISENQQSIDSLRQLIKNGKGKYYMHCYLGKDRVNAAARIVKQENREMQDYGVAKKESGLLDKEFERGPVVELEKDVYLAPLPTKEEYLDVVVEFQQVVSLSDLKNEEAKKRNNEEQQWLKPYNIPFKVFDVSAATSKAQMQEVVKQVKAMPKPIFIHGFFADDKEMLLFKSLYSTVQL
jgi:protein tyrosine phosphatase (PTP) superfamily phosphohydrolase (DUF442 family)